MQWTRWFKNNWKFIFIFVVPIVLAVIPIVGQREEAKCGYVFVVMVAYWMTEVVPIAVTALIPVFAFPMLGILSTADCCLAYMKQTNMMFLGSLMVAISVEQCNLHKRIALFVILHVGQSPRRLMAGFMLTTTVLSMWIANTATTAMMVPIVTAIMQELYPDPEEQEQENRPRGDEMELQEEPQGIANEGFVHDGNNIQADIIQEAERDRNVVAENRADRNVAAENRDHNNEERDHLTKALFLAVAYSANIGGTGVITGTAPNLVLRAVLVSSFEKPTGLNFTTWMAYSIPGIIICAVLSWIWLQVLFLGLGRNRSLIQAPNTERVAAVRRLISQRYRELGRITQQEITVLILFLLLVSLWIFRQPEFIPGWASVFTHDLKIGDATPAMLIVFLLFAFPAKLQFPWSSDLRDPPKSCHSWAAIQEKVPWGVVLLLGGGFAMAEASEQSGLSAWLGLQFVGLQVLPKEAIVTLISLMITMITQVSSNTATSVRFLPVLREMALNININPLYLMIPATICCSYAFMLPVATAPNAIVFASCNMRTVDMMKAGIVLNLICIVVSTIMINTLGVAMFDLHNMPDWAQNVTQS